MNSNDIKEVARGGVRWFILHQKETGVYLKVRDDYFYSINFSLAKYMRGENVTNNTISENIDGVNCFCNEYGIEPAGAKLGRVDIGLNVIEPPAPTIQLLNQLGKLKGFVLKEDYKRKGSLYYEQKKRKLIFYDKGAEAGIDADILRYEYRAMKIKGTLADLTEKATYQRLLKLWITQYNNIQKLNTMDFATIKKPTDAERALLATLLSEKVKKKGLNYIDNFVACCTFKTPSQKTNFGKLLHKLASEGGGTSASIEELNSRMFELYEKFND